jgi:hypothetical protein
MLAKHPNKDLRMLKLTGTQKSIVLPAVAALFLTACTGASETESGTTYQVYFLGGQSNMDGYGYVSELPPELNGRVPGVWIFHGNTVPDDSSGGGAGLWAELRPGHGVGFSSDGMENFYSDRFGVEVTFARQLRQQNPEADIAIIKYSRGGTSIDAAAAGEAGSWDPDYGGGDGVNQYDHFVATVLNATAVSDIDGDGAPDRLVPAGIIWMQGESDGAYTEEIAKRYLNNLTRLVGLIRGAFQDDNLPVVIGRISDSGQDEDGMVWDFGDIVREAEAEFVESDHSAALVTSTDDYSYSDPWHYDSAGYIDLGMRFAEAVAGIQH